MEIKIQKLEEEYQFETKLFKFNFYLNNVTNKVTVQKTAKNESYAQIDTFILDHTKEEIIDIAESLKAMVAHLQEQRKKSPSGSQGGGVTNAEGGHAGGR